MSSAKKISEHDAKNYLPERFIKKVDFSGDCWTWTASKNTDGYGAYWTGNKIERAHRFSWAQLNGEIPENLCICHRCDNPPCVNPNHLFLGTVRDNSLDMLAKGRGNKPTGERQNTPKCIASRPRGEKHKHSKLKQTEVDEIRNLYQKGRQINSEFKIPGLAKKYGVSTTTINNILNNRKWKLPHAT